MNPTPKQKKFVEVYVETDGDHIQAAKTAYPGVKNPSDMASYVLSSKAVQKYMERVFIRKNAHNLIIDKLIDMLEAQKVTAHGSAADNRAQLDAVRQIREIMELDAPKEDHREYHLHINMEEQPLEVLQFMIDHGREPDEQEMKALAAG